MKKMLFAIIILATIAITAFVVTNCEVMSVKKSQHITISTRIDTGFIEELKSILK